MNEECKQHLCAPATRFEDVETSVAMRSNTARNRAPRDRDRAIVIVAILDRVSGFSLASSNVLP